MKIVEDRGFGFVRQDGQRHDTFFHFRDLHESIEFGPHLVEMRVTFEREEAPGGRVKAVDIRPEY